MPEQVVVTRLEADVSELEKQLRDTGATLDEWAKKGEKAGRDLSGALGSTTGKLKDHVQSLREAAKVQDRLTNATVSAGRAAQQAAAAGVKVTRDQAKADQERLGLIQDIRKAIKELEDAQDLAKNEDELVKINKRLAEARIHLAEMRKIGLPDVEPAAKGAASFATRMRQATNEVNALVDASDGKMTPEIISAAKEAGRLRLQFSDMRRVIDSLDPAARFQAFAGIAQTAAGGLTTMAGALSLVRGGSEDMTRTIARMQGLLAVVQGASSFFTGFRQALATINALVVANTTSTTANTAVKGANTAATVANTAATTAGAGATGVMATAVRSLTAAMAANPITTAIVVLAGIATALLALGNEADDAADKADRLVDKLNEFQAFNATRSSHQQRMADLNAELDAMLAGDTEEANIAKNRQQRMNELARLQRDLADVTANQDELEAKRAELLNGKLTKDRIDAIHKLDKAIETSNNQRIALSEQVDVATLKGQVATLKQAKDAATKREQIEKEAAEKRRTLAAKSAKEAEDAARKAAEQERQIIEEQANLTLKALEQQRAAEDALYRQGLSDDEQASFDIQVNSDQVVEQVNATYDRLIEIARQRGEDTEVLEQQRTDTITAINQKAEQDLATLAQEQLDRDNALREQALEAIRQATGERYDLEVAAAQKRFDVLREMAEKNISDEVERSAQLAEIETARQAALADIKTDAQIEEQNRLQAHQEAMAGIVQQSGQQLASTLEAFASGQIDSAEEAGKALAKVAIDTIATIAQTAIIGIISESALFGAKTGGPIGAAAGIAAGTAIGAIIRGLLNQMLSQVQGHYEGTPYVDGRPDLATGRDAYLRRLHKGERIVPTDDNRKYWEPLEAIRKDKLDEWVRANYALDPISLNFLPVDVHKVIEVANGQPQQPRWTDPNAIRLQRQLVGLQKEGNELLRELMPKRPTNSASKR